MRKYFKIGNVIREKLLASPEIKTMVADRVFPVVVPRVTEGDFIVYFREKYARSHNNMGTLDECQVLLVVGSTGYARSLDLAELVDDTLEGIMVDEKIRQCRLVDSTEESDADVYFQVLLYEIKF